jgi:hypothetical protein
MVEQLRDLGRGFLVRLVLRGHPHLGGLFDDLLPDRVHSGVEFGNSARAFGAGNRLSGEFLKERVEGFHHPRLSRLVAPCGVGTIVRMAGSFAQCANSLLGSIRSKNARTRNEGIGPRLGR